MTDRDRLIELLKSDLPNFTNNVAFWHNEHIGEFADCLIENGVIVPPCKVGDIVYTIFERDIEALTVICIKTEERDNVFYRFYDAKNNFLISLVLFIFSLCSAYLTNTSFEKLMKDALNLELVFQYK